MMDQFNAVLMDSQLVSLQMFVSLILFVRIFNDVWLTNTATAISLSIDGTDRLVTR
jgi:hypothetical protein